MKRFEILLPLDYNDGTQVEPEKLDQTSEELSDRFSAITQDTTGITGSWKYSGSRYRDRLLRIRVDTDDIEASAFLKTYKETLKARCKQIDYLDHLSGNRNYLEAFLMLTRLIKTQT